MRPTCVSAMCVLIQSACSSQVHSSSWLLLWPPCDRLTNTVRLLPQGLSVRRPLLLPLLCCCIWLFPRKTLSSSAPERAPLSIFLLVHISFPPQQTVYTPVLVYPAHMVQCKLMSSVLSPIASLEFIVAFPLSNLEMVVLGAVGVFSLVLL